MPINTRPANYRGRNDTCAIASRGARVLPTSGIVRAGRPSQTAAPRGAPTGSPATTARCAALAHVPKGLLSGGCDSQTCCPITVGQLKGATTEESRRGFTPGVGNGSPASREVHTGFCERQGVRFPCRLSSSWGLKVRKMRGGSWPNWVHGWASSGWSCTRTRPGWLSSAGCRRRCLCRCGLQTLVRRGNALPGRLHRRHGRDPYLHDGRAAAARVLYTSGH